MPEDLSPEEFTLALPLAVQWAEHYQNVILRTGTPLTDDQQNDARLAGVKHPEKIKVAVVPAVPRPDTGMLKHFNDIVGLVNHNTVALSLHYGIFIRKDCPNPREVLVHECVHTAQYEWLGGVEGFLKQYQAECNQFGYPEAPMEQEAIVTSQKICT